MRERPRLCKPLIYETSPEVRTKTGVKRQSLSSDLIILALDAQQHHARFKRRVKTNFLKIIAEFGAQGRTYLSCKCTRCPSCSCASAPPGSGRFRRSPTGRWTAGPPRRSTAGVAPSGGPPATWWRSARGTASSRGWRSSTARSAIRWSTAGTCSQDVHVYEISTSRFAPLPSDFAVTCDTAF